MAAAAEVDQIMRLSRDAQDRAEKACEPLRARQIGWEEERVIGQELAINLVAKTGHLYLDGMTENDPVKLLQSLDERKTVSLPAGGRNGVSAHVALVGRN